MESFDIFNDLWLPIAFSYVDSGYFDKKSWTKKMTHYFEVRGIWGDLPQKERNSILEYLWKSDYKNGKENHSISDWADKKCRDTKSQDQMRNSIDRLFNAIESYRSCDFFRDLLHFCTSFKELSPYNLMMVKTQMPSARYVLTQKEWKKKYDRRPLRNARPLIILRKFGPIDYVFEIGDTQPIHNNLFTEETYDIIQSVAKPFETTGTVDNEVYNGLINALPFYGIEICKFRVASSFGAEIRKTDCTVKIKDIKTHGYYTISVNDKADNSEVFASVCHELGHLFCHHLVAPKSGDKDWWTWRKLSWEQEEFEAEIVSYLICERFGVGNESWRYLSSVIGQHGKIPEGISLDRVFKAANEIERMITSDKLSPRTCLLYQNDKIFRKEYDKVYPQENGQNE